MVALSEFRLEIVKKCQKDREEHRYDGSARPWVPHEDYLIKYHPSSYLDPEYRTMRYLSALAEVDPDAPHIPKIVDYFKDGTMAYLVLERVESGSVPVKDVSEQVAEALRWLGNAPPPPGSNVGPVGGGRLLHHFFSDFVAPLAFSSVDAMERYVNEARKLVPDAVRPSEVSFKGEKLVFTLSFMNERNFVVDTEGRVWLIDFETVTLLPESFASFTMSIPSSFAIDVSKHLNWAQSPNVTRMWEVSEALGMIANPGLGLDNDGFPKVR